MFLNPQDVSVAASKAQEGCVVAFALRPATQDLSFLRIHHP